MPISVTDTIRVENELSQVQGQIEQIAGRLRYLHDQADMSTITVSLKQAGAAATAPPSRARCEARSAAPGTER